MNDIRLLTTVMRQLAYADVLNGCIDEYLNKVDAEADRAVGFWIENDGKDPEPGRIAILELYGWPDKPMFVVARFDPDPKNGNLKWVTMDGHSWFNHLIVKRFAYLERTKK